MPPSQIHLSDCFHKRKVSLQMINSIIFFQVCLYVFGKNKIFFFPLLCDSHISHISGFYFNKSPSSEPIQRIFLFHFRQERSTVHVNSVEKVLVFTLIQMVLP